MNKKLVYLIISNIVFFSTIAFAKIEQPMVINSAKLQWQDASELPGGVKVAVLAGNPRKKEPFVARVKLPANYAIPVHSHPVNEYDTVLSGTLYFGMGSQANPTQVFPITAGNFIMIPAKFSHYGWTKEETIIQISGVGPWGVIYNHSKSA